MFVLNVAAITAHDTDAVAALLGDFSPLIASGVEPDHERVRAFHRLRDSVLATSTRPGLSESLVTLELLRETMELGRLVDANPHGPDTDWTLREQSDRIRDVLDVMRRGFDHALLDDPAAAARFVLETLYDTRHKDIARLVGVDERTIRTWVKTPPQQIRKNGTRITLVAQLLYDLRGMYTPRGVVRWFERPRHELDEQCPLDLLDDDPIAAIEPLRTLARGARGQLGT